MKQKSLLFFSVIVFVSATVTFSDSTLAGRYELIQGKGVEVCEAYQKNLNSFKPDYTTMICERQVARDAKYFAKPKWQEIDVQHAENLVLEENSLALQAMGSSQTKEQEAGFQQWARGEIEEKTRVLELSSIDIDNDGKLDSVVRDHNGRCLAQRAYSVSIAVLTEDGRHFDVGRSKYVDPDFSKIAAKLAKDSSPQSLRTAGIRRDEVHGYLLYDVFLYKGKSYFDLWEMGKGFPNPAAARLRVFSWQGGNTRELCTYRFSVAD